MEELESLLERVDHNSKIQIEELTAKLHNRASEASGLSLENERLKVRNNLDYPLKTFCHIDLSLSKYVILSVNFVRRYSLEVKH